MLASRAAMSTGIFKGRALKLILRIKALRAIVTGSGTSILVQNKVLYRHWRPKAVDYFSNSIELVPMAQCYGIEKRQKRAFALDFVQLGLGRVPNLCSATNRGRQLAAAGKPLPWNGISTVSCNTMPAGTRAIALVELSALLPWQWLRRKKREHSSNFCSPGQCIPNGINGFLWNLIFQL